MLTVRKTRPEDDEALAAILNRIIEIGGTTAYQTPRAPETFRIDVLERYGLISCVVAEVDGTVAGFQYLSWHTERPEGWADIATFARPEPKVRGVGRALMTVTLDAARATGVRTVNATIRADNDQGLGFYEAMGFETYRVDEAVPLTDGTPVDRISKRLDL